MTIRPLTVLLPIVVLVLSGCLYVHIRTSRPDYALPGTPHPQYDITDIGPGRAEDINNKGQIVGSFIAGPVPHSSVGTNHAPALIVHGFLWENGKRTEMRTFGGWWSEADKISDQGQVIGSASVLGSLIPPVTHDCFWDGTNLMDLEADPRFRGSQAIHVTSSGAVYVVCPPPGMKGPQHLWLYPSGFYPGNGHDLGVIGGEHISVSAINDNGTVVGSRSAKDEAAGTVQRAFIWQKGNLTHLGTFGGRNSRAFALNDLGQVVGFAETKDYDANTEGEQPRHAFLWEKGRMRDLGTLPGGETSTATGINGKGQIVGTSDGRGHGFMSIHPVLWENGQVKDLTQLIPTQTKWSWLNKPTGINDKGQIVGDGDIQGDTHGPITVIAGGAGDGYLLTPK